MVFRGHMKAARHLKDAEVYRSWPIGRMQHICRDTDWLWVASLSSRDAGMQGHLLKQLMP